MIRLLLIPFINIRSTLEGIDHGAIHIKMRKSSRVRLKGSEGKCGQVL